MKNFLGVSELCERILDGMGVEYEPIAGSSILSAQGDLWRVELSSDPEGYYLSLAEEVGVREALITGFQFYGLASLFGLKLLDVLIHEKGMFWLTDSTSTLNVGGSASGRK